MSRHPGLRWWFPGRAAVSNPYALERHYHDPDFTQQTESGFAPCKVCGAPLDAERWLNEPCPGRPAGARP